jgi:hypothetical protein
VRRGHHGASVEIPRADEVVEHLGAHHPGVEHAATLGDEPVADPAADLGGLVSHVASEPHPEVHGLLAAQIGQDPGERTRDQVGGLGVDLRSVEAADVVSLEDAGRDSRQSFPFRLS